MFVQTASYVVTQGEIPVISGFNLFTKEADTTLGWNLILVNDDYCVPSDYEVELTELSNGKKWIHEFIRSFSKCSIMPERLAPNYS